VLPGPACTDTGEPGALAKKDCSDAFEGTLLEGHEIKNDAASNTVKRTTIAGILRIEITATLLSSRS
jgi:hypothetical protein